MEIEILPMPLSVLRLESDRDVDWQGEIVFLCKSDDEVSLVCETGRAPQSYQQRVDGWRAMRIRGTLDFALVGLLARLTHALSEADIPLFAVSTFDTDYILVNQAHMYRAARALAGCGYSMCWRFGLGMHIRGAQEADLPLLCDLAFRSKAYWGYDEDFMEACRQALCVTVPYLHANDVFVAQDSDGTVKGFCCLRQENGMCHMDALFVDPSHMRAGMGKALFAHGVNLARDRGVHGMRIEADPHAEGFYTKMGAARIGEADSECVGGRKLPLMEIEL